MNTQTQIAPPTAAPTASLMSPELQKHIEEILAKLELGELRAISNKDVQLSLESARVQLRNVLVVARRTDPQSKNAQSGVKFKISAKPPQYVVPNGFSPIEIELSEPAPRDGLKLTLTSSHPKVISISGKRAAETDIIIPAYMTKPAAQPLAFGISPGKALITISGPPYFGTSVEIECVQ